MCPKQFVHNLAIYSLSDLKSKHAVQSNWELLAKPRIPSWAEPGETWFTGCQHAAKKQALSNFYCSFIAASWPPNGS